MLKKLSYILAAITLVCTMAFAAGCGSKNSDDKQAAQKASFRSIADIARSEGENLQLIETKLACLTVFALGGSSGKDDGTESGYYAVKVLLAKQISETAKYVVERGLAEEGAPALVRLLATIASRFGVTVSQKAAASAVPVIGAAGGALINSIFMDHFQNMARGHFIIRNLEKKYGAEEVSRVYNHSS